MLNLAEQHPLQSLPAGVDAYGGNLITPHPANFIPEPSSTVDVHSPSEFTTGQRVRAFLKTFATVGTLMVATWLFAEGKIQNPLTPERIHDETNNPGYTVLDPGHIDLSR